MPEVVLLTKFKLSIPKLVDYEVTIPPGGKTDALVRAAITWQIDSSNKTTITTREVNPMPLS